MNRDKVYNAVRNVLEIRSFLSVLFPTAPRAGRRARGQNKRKTETKSRLQTYGTITARNVIREQHESGEQGYNMKRPAMLNYELIPCYIMNSSAMQISITNSSGMHRHGYPRCKLQSSPATQNHNQFCHGKSRIAYT